MYDEYTIVGKRKNAVLVAEEDWHAIYNGPTGLTLYLIFKL